VGWSEWNDRFRDDVRAFWLTGETGPAGLAQRLAGSSDIFQDRRQASGRAPQASLNFITAHDGFTLRDLLSYQHKHNELNGEGNRDGNDHNHAWNCGCEGECADPAVQEQRRRLQRALLATLFIAQGVPMLQGGDELGRTQAGNNNAYCQDSELTWLNWGPSSSPALAEKTRKETHGLHKFVAGLIELRRRFPQLRQRDWLTGERNASGRRDVIWWHPAGHEMRMGDWQSPALGVFGLQLAATIGHDGAPSLLCLINREAQAVAFHLPEGNWRQICDSGAELPFAPVSRQSGYPLPSRSLQMLTLE
jgi:glycogen debranching enzyme GlgX